MDKALINKRVLAALNYIIERHNVTKTALAEVLDTKPAKFSEILNERMNAGVDIMATICVTYNISAEWLLTGKGSMLKGDEPTTEAAPPIQAEGSPMADALLAQLAEKDRQIAQLLALMSSITNK